VYIRFPTLEDLNACFQLDTQVATEYVWQLQRATEAGRLTATLQRVRLPRPMRVTYLDLGESLRTHYEANDGIWVAVDGGQVLGFVDVDWYPDQGLAWIMHLVVDRPWRRRGIGRALLTRALRAAVDRGMDRAMAAVNTKNDPAVSFLQKHGFAYAGYNDAFLPRGDIAIYLARTLGRWSPAGERW